MNENSKFAKEEKLMNTQRVIGSALALSAAVCLAPLTRAQTLDLTLLDATQTVIQGTTVVAFDATVFNPSTTATIYLNGDAATTASSWPPI